MIENILNIIVHFVERSVYENANDVLFHPLAITLDLDFQPDWGGPDVEEANE